MPLPAGLEAVDPNLATSARRDEEESAEDESEDAYELFWWRPGFDHVELREMLREAMVLSGYECLTAGNGREALEALDRQAAAGSLPNYTFQAVATIVLSVLLMALNYIGIRESANFNMLNVRHTARTQRLRTEASARFERGLDPSKRSQLGAHYTDRDSILRVVEPVVMAPLTT